MKGVWLFKTDAAFAVGKTPRQFMDKVFPTLHFKGEGKKRRFFIPEDMMTDFAKEGYEGQFVELDDDAAEVQDVLGDVSYDDVGEELKTARLDKMRAETALLNEKLAARKEELFSEWSERFFSVFSESFAKFKNALIDIHLDEEQLSLLNEKLDTALKSMGDKLAEINTEWLAEDVEDDKA